MKSIDRNATKACAHVLSLALLLWGNLSAAGASNNKGAFSTNQSTATLTVTYTLTGSGIERPSSNERNVTWTVNDRYESKATMIAQKPGDSPGLHAIAADGKPAMPVADEEQQAMIELGQKAIAKCGNDQACVQREFMSMADDPAPAVHSSAPSGPRYQEFQGGLQSGTYHVDEKAHEAYYDAACSSHNEAPCAFDTQVTGEGTALNTEGRSSYRTSIIGELDLVGATFSLFLPATGFGKVKRTVTTVSKDVKAGTFDATRSLRAGLFREQVRVSCGQCRAASGTTTLQVEDELLKRTAKLVIEWKFTRP